MTEGGNKETADIHFLQLQGDLILDATLFSILSLIFLSSKELWA